MLVLTSRVKVLSMSRTIVLVFTSRVKVKNVMALVATSSVKILSISRSLGSEVLPTVAATHACTRTSSSASPKATQMPSFSMQGMGRSAYIGNIDLPTSAHNTEGLTLALHVADRPTEASGRNSTAGSHKRLSQE